MTSLTLRREAPARPAATRRLTVLRRRWGPELVVLVSAGFVLPIVVACHYGSLSAPVSDDWAYDLAAYHLAFHGSIDLYHWGTITLIGQLFLAVPILWVLGPHIWVLNVWTCGIGLAGLVAVDSLGRGLGLSRRQALFAAVLMGAGPMWATLATSFMTDVQSVSVMAIALAVAAGDTRTDRMVTPRTLLALTLAGLAFTIRDPTGVAFLAIAWGRWGRGRPVDRRSAARWAGVVGAFLAGLAMFYVWRRRLPSGSVEVSAQWSYLWLGPWWYGEWLFPLIGLMLAPVAVLMGPVDIVRWALRTSRGWLLLAWILMPIGPVVRWFLYVLDSRGVREQRPSAIVSALLPPMGNSFFDLTRLSGTGRVLPLALTAALALIAVSSTMVVMAAVVLGVRQWATRPHPPSEAADQPHRTALMLAVVALGSGLVWAVLIASNRVMWDRYVFPGTMACTLLLLYLARQLRPDSRVSTGTWRFSAIALCGLAALSLVMAIRLDGYTGSQWRYSNQFAETVRPIPRGLISTDWTWTSTQNHALTALGSSESLGYRPCYVEAVDGPDAAGVVDFARGGSWVEPDTYSMSVVPPAEASPACRRPARH